MADRGLQSAQRHRCEPLATAGNRPERGLGRSVGLLQDSRTCKIPYYLHQRFRRRCRLAAEEIADAPTFRTFGKIYWPRGCEKMRKFGAAVGDREHRVDGRGQKL